MYSPNFSVENKAFCLSLHYNNKSDSYLYVNDKEVVKFKTKYQSNFNGKYLCQMCLGNVSSEFNLIDRKSAGLHGYVYYFSVDYDAIAVDDILDIHKHLMEKNNIVYMWRFTKKVFAVITTFLNLSYVNCLECVAMSNQVCRARPKIIDVNANEPVFYPYNIKVIKCGGSCNNINNPYTKLCAPDIVKNINVKVYNLMSRIN